MAGSVTAPLPALNGYVCSIEIKFSVTWFGKMLSYF